MLCRVFWINQEASFACQVRYDMAVDGPGINWDGGMMCVGSGWWMAHGTGRMALGMHNAVISWCYPALYAQPTVIETRWAATRQHTPVVGFEFMVC